jgi:hypothetical protein
MGTWHFEATKPVANGRRTLKQPTCTAHSTAPHLHHRLPHAAHIKLCDEQHEGVDTRREAHAEGLCITVSWQTDRFRVPQTDGLVVQPACAKYSARQADRSGPAVWRAWGLPRPHLMSDAEYCT